MRRIFQPRHTSTASAQTQKNHAQKPTKTFADYLFNTIKEIFNYGGDEPRPLELGRWNLDEDHKDRIVKKIDAANSDNSCQK
jgi:hypothetical protein